MTLQELKDFTALQVVEGFAPIEIEDDSLRELVVRVQNDLESIDALLLEARTPTPESFEQ